MADTAIQTQAAKRFGDLSPAQQRQTREWTAGRVKVLLNHFWRPDDPVEVEEALIRDWVEVLKDYPSAEVNAACRDYLAHPERTEAGRPVRPIPGTIVRIIERDRSRAAMARLATQRPVAATEPRQIVTPEQAKAILAEVYGGQPEAEA